MPPILGWPVLHHKTQMVAYMVAHITLINWFIAKIYHFLSNFNINDLFYLKSGKHMCRLVNPTRRKNFNKLPNTVILLVYRGYYLNSFSFCELLWLINFFYRRFWSSVFIMLGGPGLEAVVDRKYNVSSFFFALVVVSANFCSKDVWHQLLFPVN